jgi:hypothetical protein
MNTNVGIVPTANNTRLPGGKSTAPNCRFEASAAVPLEDSLAASCRLCGNFGKRETLFDNKLAPSRRTATKSIKK